MAVSAREKAYFNIYINALCEFMMTLILSEIEPCREANV